ncbi:MAG: hypothetical protein AB1801_28815, partial [Chloroflexota bacterium]
MPDNVPILYTGVVGSYATEKLVEPILDFQLTLEKLENGLALLKNANGAEENRILALAENSLAEFNISVQKPGNVAVDVFSEIDENMENYRRLVAENKIPKEHVENYGKSIGELKLWLESLLAMSSALCESVGSLEAENIDVILTLLAEIKSQLEGRIYSHTVSLDSYRFIPSFGYQNETCYFTFTLKNDGWLSASWNGSFLITVDGNVYKSWQNIRIPSGGGTYTDSMGFVPDSPGNKSWSFIVNWNDGWSSGTIHITGTFPVVNRDPTSKYNPVKPSEPKPWGTTFTYWTDIKDEDGDTVTVSLYKDGVQHDGTKTVYGSGTATWTWASTKDDIKTHNYYFAVVDEYGAMIRDPPIDANPNTYSGPTVTRRSTTLSIQPPEFSIGVNQTATMYARVRDGFDGSYPSGKTVTWSATGGTWLSQTAVATDAQGYAWVSWMAPNAPMNITFTASFAGDAHYDGSSASSRASTYIPTTPDFSVNVSPAAAIVNPGSSATATVTVESINNYSSTVTLGTGALPAGVTASFWPTSGTPGYNS